MGRNPAWLAFTAEAIAAQTDLYGEDLILYDWLLWLNKRRTIVMDFGEDIYDAAPVSFQQSTGRKLTGEEQRALTDFYMWLDQGDCINRGDSDVDEVEVIWFNSYGVKSTETKSSAEVYANILVRDYREEMGSDG